MTAKQPAVTIALVREVDALVRERATYVHDPLLQDTWTSFAKQVLAGAYFEGDCDDWAQTAVHILALRGVPKRQLFRALVASQGAVIDHMIGLVELDNGEIWSVGDTFGPPQKVKDHKAGPHTIIQTARVSEGRKFRDWTGKALKRETNSASMGMRTSAKGRAFIKGYEKFVALPYDDFRPRYTLKPSDKILGTLTGGYGYTGRELKIGEKITQARAELWFDKDVATFEAAVRKLVRVSLNQDQFDALVSFAFNCGETNLSTSTLLKKINARAPAHEIQAQFRRWTRSKGVVLEGLVRRRNAEAAMWVGEVVTHGVATAMLRAPDISPEPLVEEDRSVGKSPDIWLTGGATGAGAVSVWAAVQEAVRDFRDTLADTNMTLVLSVASIAMAVIGAVLLYKRLREIRAATRR